MKLSDFNKSEMGIDSNKFLVFWQQCELKETAPTTTH